MLRTRRVEEVGRETPVDSIFILIAVAWPLSELEFVRGTEYIVDQILEKARRRTVFNIRIRSVYEIVK